MKKLFFILFFALLSGCASTNAPFDPVTVFEDAEKSMREENYEEARKKYQELQEKSPDKSFDAVIMLRIADTFYGEEKYEEALVEYQNFLNYHPVNKDAVYAQFQVAMCSFQQLSTIDRDPETTRTALREFQKLIEKYPKSVYHEKAEKNIVMCKDRLAEYELYVGKFYFRKRAYTSALGRLDVLLRDFPGSSSEKEAIYYKGLAHFELGERPQARSALETLVRKYPSMTGEVMPLLDKLTTP
jgi:outer membrane protein assembly factor BamD